MRHCKRVLLVCYSCLFPSNSMCQWIQGPSCCYLCLILLQNMCQCMQGPFFVVYLCLFLSQSIYQWMRGPCCLLPVFVSFTQHVSMNVGSLLFVTCICFFQTTCFNKCGVFIVCYMCLFLLQSICQWIWGSLLFVTCVCFLYRACVTRCEILFFFCLFLYLYLAQCLHVLQDSKCCITHSTAQVQSYSQITDIPLTKRQRLKDDHLSTPLIFFNLPLGYNPMTEDSHFKWSSKPLCICLYLGLNSRLCVPRRVYYLLRHSGRQVFFLIVTCVCFFCRACINGCGVHIVCYLVFFFH